MKYMICLSEQNKGFILLPIILTLAVLAAIALMINREGAINAGNVIREHQPETISYVGAAGLAIGEKELKQDTDCSAYSVTGSSVFNGKNYTSSITPNNGSPVTLKVDVDQGGGANRQFVRQVKMYDSTPGAQVLNPSQDSHSRLTNPTTNYNSGAEANRLHVNYSIIGLPDRTSYLQFNLSGVTVPAEDIQSATLELHSGGTPETNSVSVGVNRIKNDWLETQVTYNNRKTGVAWQPTDIDWTPSAQTVVNENVVGWKIWDVTDLVKGWLAGTYPNYGLALMGQIGKTNNLEFISQNDPDTSKRPILRITSPCECGNGSGGAVEIKPGSEGVDTYLTNGGQAGVNQGASDYLFVSEQNANKEHALLRFDITGLPAAASITSANLQLNFQSAGGTNAGTITAHRVLAPWTEFQATWNAPTGGSPWANPGGDYTLTAAASAAVDTLAPGNTSWDLTALVADWHAGTYSNEGILLAASTGLNNALFSSSDVADASKHPKLSINYTCPCGVACTYTPPVLPYGTRLLLVVANAGSLTTGEITRKNLISSWGFTVTPISASATQSNFDAAVAVNDVVYISETVSPTYVGTKLTSAAIGVVNEERDLTDEFGLSTNSSSIPDQTSLTIAANNHYITEAFPLGLITLFSSAQQAIKINGTYAPGLQILGKYGASESLVSLPQGAEMSAGGTAAGRRVLLPWGDTTGFDPNSLTSNAKIMMRRAIEWAGGAGADGGASGTTLSAIADSLMAIDTPTSNYGANNQIIVNNKSGFINHGLLRFDTTSFAPLTPVTNAKLQLWVRDNRSPSDANIEVYKVTNAWQENEVTWNKRISTNSWTTAGGDYAATIIATQMLPGGVKQVFLEWDITSLVQQWVDTPSSNHGLLLKTNVPKDIKFSSKEITVPVEQPRLIISQ